MIRLIICDDQEIVRKGLNIILTHEEGIEVIGLAHNGKEALDLARRTKPDLILMDLKMPVLNGIETTRAVKKELPDTKVLVLTTFDGDDWVFDAIRAGASGYLLKDSDGDKITTAIRETMDDRVILDPQIAGKIIDAFNQFEQQPPQPKRSVPTDLPHFEHLTSREMSILEQMALGKTNAQIAEVCFLAEGTVKNNVSQIIQKLHVNTRTQAILKALKSGLVDL